MIPDIYKWRRRMFASVDIAGSTAYKQSNANDSSKWVDTFKQFFADFPNTLKQKFVELDSVSDQKPKDPLEVWKFIGDEVLFVAELQSHEEVAYHVMSFKSALQSYSENLMQKLPALSLKGTMWGAGFPVTNAQVTTPVQNGEHQILDYLGPCIDQGFRLCSLADSRRIPISVDLAYMLAKTSLDDGGRSLMLGCDEPKLHKGVARPYPHIWVDRLDGAASHEDKILKRRPSMKPSELEDYLQELFSRKQQGIFRPFIETDRSPSFRQVPPEMESTRRQMIQSSPEQSYTAVETEATGAPRADADVPRPPESV